MCLAGLALLAAVEGRWVLRAGFIPVLTAAALLGPWLVQRVGHPFRMWWEAGFPLAGHASALDLLFGRAGGPSAPLWFNLGVPIIAALAIVPRRTRTQVLMCWYVALIALAFAVLGSALSFTTPAGPAPIAAWLGVPVGIWTGSLMAGVMFAVPEVLGMPRAALVTLAVVILLVPVGAAGWWVVRGAGNPLEMAPRDAVPAFLTAHRGSALVVTGSVQQGVDARVVKGNGVFLGQEALASERSHSDAMRAATARLLARPSRQDVAALSTLGIGSIYAPHADPSIVRRIDGAPGLEPAGSDSPDSRVWLLSDTPANVETHASRWRRLIGGGELAAWLIAIALTAPVRRRRALPALGDEGDDS
jgi:hypothetical protein